MREGKGLKGFKPIILHCKPVAGEFGFMSRSKIKNLLVTNTTLCLCEHAKINYI